jgi:hypothetical protein
VSYCPPRLFFESVDVLICYDVRILTQLFENALPLVVTEEDEGDQFVSVTKSIDASISRSVH